MQRKKLQVFVSSTYTDLIVERQIAVEAILESGHIPAGMELFTAGDESQMKVIKRWIDESDVFLLILGLRYGSIEPTTQKSYTHLEYEYAVSVGKPYFAVVIESEQEEHRVKKYGVAALERENPKKWRAFYQDVISEAMVKFWTNPMEIKLSIFQTMAELARREELKGWVPGDQAFNAGPLAEEIARLTKENADLRTAFARARGSGDLFGGLSLQEYIKLLSSRLIQRTSESSDSMLDKIVVPKEVLERLGLSEKPLSLLHVLWAKRKPLREGILRAPKDPLDDALFQLRELGVILKNQMLHGEIWIVSNDGRKLLLRLEHKAFAS